jgi:hypothetical protein
LIEEWRSIPIVGLPSRYQVSNLGRLRSLPFIDVIGRRRSERLFNPADAQVDLILEDGTSKWFALAALILRAFVGPPPDGCRLSRHLDDDRSNNKLENLAWGTDLDNIYDALRNGRSFASYGHLGKTLSDESKQKISQKLKGRKTGRVISESHRLALLAGYRKKFPERVQFSRSCACGCGRRTKPGRCFIHGHHIVLNNPSPFIKR